MTLLNSMISTNSLFLSAKIKGFIPLSSNKLMLRAIYKHEHNFEFVVYDLSETRTQKLHRFNLSTKEVLSLDQFVPFQLPVEGLVSYLRQNRQSRYSFIPENLVITFSIPEGSLVLEDKQKFCITLYSPHFHAREEHYFSFEELTALKHSWFKFTPSFLSTEDTFWVRHINGIYEVVKYHHGGEHAFIECGNVNLRKINSEVIEDAMNISWDFLSDHERAVASLIYHDLLDASYCIGIRELKKELKQSYSISM